MVKIQTTWIDKKDQNKEKVLKTPKIKVGNNMGEDEEVILDLKSNIYRNNFEFKNKSGTMQKGSTFSIKAEYKGQELYADLTYMTAVELETYADFVGHKFKFTREMDGTKTKIVVTPLTDCPKGENPNKVTGQSDKKSAVEEMTMEKLQEELAKFFNSEQLTKWNKLYNGPVENGGCPPDRRSKAHFFATIAKQWIPTIHDKVMKAYVPTETIKS